MSPSASGTTQSQAVQLYFDKINKSGGVNGKKILLTNFDDKNDAKEARKQALEIARQNQALAVIGHWYSSASIAGGKIYKENKGLA